nr:hypothetical protein [Streptomyces sp. HUCO-GS316]
MVLDLVAEVAGEDVEEEAAVDVRRTLELAFVPLAAVPPSISSSVKVRTSPGN